MSSLADVQSVLKSTFSSSELKKNQLKMAKIALIFLLFALFAVAMAGRIPREEATPSPIQQIQENFEKFANSDAVKELAEGFKNLGDSALNLVKDASKTINENLQKAGGNS